MLYPQLNEKRDLICLDGIWQTTVHNQAIDLAVPASWNEQCSELFDYFGIVRYKKEVFIPGTYVDKLIWLRFGSVATKATVYVNGTKVRYHEGAHLPFECEISNYVRLGEKNIIEVDVDNTLNPWGLPPAKLLENEGRAGFQTSYPSVTYDFYPYGGIHRSVYLYSTEKNRIEGVKIDTQLDGTVRFRISLNEKIQGTLKATIGDLECRIVFDGREVEGSIKIENPIWWECDNPHLYLLKISLYDAKELLDVYEQSFGVREVVLSGNQLLLNHKPVFLKGFGKHEDFHIIGKGFNHSVMVKDFGLMKWIGANSFRTSHYPYDEEMLSYADRQGILVIGETPFVGLNDRMYKEDILVKVKAGIEKMMDRDYNHPSVIMWSLANEPNVTTKEGEEFFKTMYETAKAKDISRPITYVAYQEPEYNLGMKYFDLICVNKYYGWYLGPGQIDETLEELSECLDRFHNEANQPVLVAEFGADAIAGMHYDPPQMFTEEFQAEIIKKQYELMRTKDYIIGTHVWAFADFKTNQTVSRVFFNRKGVFTRDRHPKMAAHMLRELWRHE